MDTYLISLLLSFMTCVLMMPLVIRGARRMNLVDAAGASHRKVHAEDIPRLGGIGIVTAFYAPLIALSFYNTKVGDRLLGDDALFMGLLGGGICIALLGLYDDLKGASPKLKLAVQIGVAVWLCTQGFVIDRIDLPFLPMLQLGWFGWVLTIGWIVGVTNAVNLIDGLDGLAAGIALFGIAPMVVLAISKGNIVLALICCCLAGSLLGFLVFNFHPARIFMGDTGSMFLGFTLAVVTIETAYKGRVAVAMLTPVLALGMPILDTLLAIARRWWFGQSLFVGDKQHIHHRLMASGYSHRATVLVMYAFAAAFATLGLLVHFNRDQESAVLFFLSLLVAGILMWKIGYLALPTRLGEEMGAAAAIRDRNKLVRQALPLLAERISEVTRLEEISATASQLAWASGAVSATLDLRPSRRTDPLRTWTWEESIEQTRDITFSLRSSDGQEQGQLTVRWDEESFHDALLPSVESGCQDLATRLGSECTEPPPLVPAVAASPSK